MVVVVDTNEKSVHQFFKSKCNVDWATRLASGGPSPLHCYLLLHFHIYLDAKDIYT